MTELQLTKHHGLGNDFLVLLDDGNHAMTAELARALCNRRTGIGADGVLQARRGENGADLDLTVWNADGSVAETSGNGLRCLAQAAVDAGLGGPDLLVRTGGETRHLHVEPESEPGLRQITAGMGLVTLGEEMPDLVAALADRLKSRRARRADTGNPHLVFEVTGPPDIQALHAVSEKVFAEKLNAEAIQLLADDHLRMWVWERGAGQTQACGSGSVASAAAARAWGLVGDRVRVSNPGGDLVVHLGSDGTATLTGPAKFIGRVQVDSDRITA